MTEEMDDKRPSRAREFLIMAIVIIVAVGAIAAGGFYRDEVTGYTRLRGWNTKPVLAATQQFLQAAAAGDSDGVAALTDLKSPDLDAVTKDGKLIAFRVTVGLTLTNVSLKKLAPDPNPELSEPHLTYTAGGRANVDATFKDAHRLLFQWDRRGGVWKVVGLSWVD